MKRSATALVGGLLFGLGISSPVMAQSVADEALVWPSSTPSNAAEAEAEMAHIMQAFGASEDRAHEIASLDEHSLAAGEPLPAALSGAEPTRSERAANDSLQAEVQIYDDGSVTLTFMQLDAIDIETDSIVTFDSATIDLSSILREDVAVRDTEQGDGLRNPVQPLATTISGCNVLPSQNGWTRRADCLIYSSAALNGISGSFRFDYSVKSAGGRIDTVYGPDRRCTGSASGTLGIDRPVNVGSNPAIATHTIVCGIGPVSVTWNQTVYAYGSVWGSFE